MCKSELLRKKPTKILLLRHFLQNKMSRRVNFHPPVLVDTSDESCMWTHSSLSELRQSGRVFKTAYDLYKYLYDFMTSKLSVGELEIHQQNCRMCITVELLNYVVGKLIAGVLSI